LRVLDLQRFKFVGVLQPAGGESQDGGEHGRAILPQHADCTIDFSTQIDGASGNFAFADDSFGAGALDGLLQPRMITFAG